MAGWVADWVAGWVEEVEGVVEAERVVERAVEAARANLPVGVGAIGSGSMRLRTSCTQSTNAWGSTRLETRDC